MQFSKQFNISMTPTVAGFLDDAGLIAKSFGHAEADASHLLAAMLLRKEVRDYIGGELREDIGALVDASGDRLRAMPSVPGVDPLPSQELSEFLTSANVKGDAKPLTPDRLFQEFARKSVGVFTTPGAQAKAGNAKLKIVEEVLPPVVPPGWSWEKIPADPLQFSVLDGAAQDLTAKARAGKIKPVVGREEEVDRILQVLLRPEKGNPVLIGEAGVGKTAVAEAVAQRIASGDVPKQLQGKKVWALDLGSLNAGTKYRGDFEDKLKKIVTDCSKGDVILFMDEMHMLMGMGATQDNSNGDAANLLKAPLANGTIQAMGATTLKEYREIEKDPALGRRFAPIVIDEPKRDAAVYILDKRLPGLEKHYDVTYDAGVTQAAVDLSIRYITNATLPDKAIDMLNDAASRKVMDASKVDPSVGENRDALALADLRVRAAKAYLDVSRNDPSLLNAQEKILANEEAAFAALVAKTPQVKISVTVADIAAAVERRAQVPVQTSAGDEREKLRNLETALKERVFGQDEAIKAVAQTMKRAGSGLNDSTKPLGSFLFLGPTGVGKTELTKALADALFKDGAALTKIDMSEYSEKHTVSRLIGSPPGYVGYGDGGQLTQAVKDKPYQVVLLDEIEKAHPDVLKVFLQVLDEGRLTDGQGMKVDFRNTVVVMTSNIGAMQQQDVVAKNPIGFAQPATPEDMSAKQKDVVLAALKEKLPPELINRVDSIQVFKSLGKDLMQNVAAKTVQSPQKLAAAQGIDLKLDAGALNWLGEVGYDKLYGARPMKRTVNDHIVTPLSEFVLSDAMKPGILATVTPDGGRLQIDFTDANGKLLGVEYSQTLQSEPEKLKAVKDIQPTGVMLPNPFAATVVGMGPKGETAVENNKGIGGR